MRAWAEVTSLEWLYIKEHVKKIQPPVAASSSNSSREHRQADIHLESSSASSATNDERLQA
ncbi:hypothetical protein BGZ76_008224, partial [Entomortierella beljakovae]